MFLQQGRDVVNYIQNELEALEREQKQIDKQAAFLEKDLRRVMESGIVLTGDGLCVCIKMYTGCNRRNGPDFGRVFLMLNYTEKPQNTYIQS
jgi:hypothetical protein